MPSSNSLNKFHEKSGDLIWYITKENEKIINLVINENLNLKNKMNYVIFQKITDFNEGIRKHSSLSIL